nr:F-box protein At5g51370-like [Ipomoea batatas]
MSSCLAEEPKLVSSPARRWSGLWMKNKKALNNVLFAMHLQSLPKNPKNPQPVVSSSPRPNKAQDFDFPVPVSDRTSLLSDETLLYILAKLPDSQRNSNSLVSKRWLNLQGRLVRSIKLLQWDFLVSGRLFHRFPNLIHVDLVNASVVSPSNSGIFCSNNAVSFHVDSILNPNDSKILLGSQEIDEGLSVLANGYPNLRRLSAMNASEMGVLSVAEDCPTLQELELHRCTDQVLRGIAACHNLQILRLIGNLDGFYKSSVSDVGLTILAQGCKRLVKLELSGCEGGYEGIKAIGQCCQMLEELTICDHRMEDGWLYALGFCRDLKTLRFVSCGSIDRRSSEFCAEIGCCPTLERLHLEKCQLRDRSSLGALFSVCQDVKEVMFHNCWGLDNDMFRTAIIFRRVKFLSIEGCSRLTIEGLEHVLLSSKELRSLRVVSCKSIKDSETSQALSALFSSLKDLKWRPDTKSLVSATIAGSGMGKRGSRFFRKGCDWKSLPGA